MEMTWARRPGRRRARAALLGATVVAILLGLAPGASAAPTLVSQTPDATASVDGRVQAIARFGGWLYVGGSFSAVSGKPRAGLARVNVASGAVDPSWTVDVVGSVIALATSPDGATLYVGGEFTSVAGAGRENLAALSAATGAIVATWNPGANRSVQALAASSDRLYVGGKFTRIGGAARARLAALSAATGAVDPAFTPNPDQWVAALRLADGRLFAAGFFTTVGGAGQPYLAELSPVTGTATGWRPSLTCPVYALDVVGSAPADTTVYVACGGSGGSALAFSTSSNLRRWLVRTDGNLHAVAYLDGAVYLGGHSTTMSGADRKKGGAVDAATGALTSWNPSFNSTFGIWAMLAVDGRLWAGGDFTKVGTTRQLRLARFSPADLTMANAADRPIFIVGCQRSGTTLLRLILDAHPNISCGPETRFLEDLARITGDRNWPRMRLFGFPKEYWHERIAALFDEFQGDYARARGKARWADKTPRYALCIDYLDQLFPTCQVVHVIRDGRDVVASHRDRWGWWAAVKAVKKWPYYLATARTSGAGLPAGRYHELRYERLVADPEATLRELLDFLGEPWDPAVLEHDKRPHDVPERYLAFASSRRVASAERPPIYRSRVGSGHKELDPLLKLLVKVVAGRTLNELDYR